MPEIVNPMHPVPTEIADELRSIDEQEMATASQRVELAKAARPTPEERKHRTALYQEIFGSVGLDADNSRSQAAFLSDSQFERIRRHDLSAPYIYPNRVPMDFEPVEPFNSDPSFWAADWNWSGTSPYVGESQADGIHFRGMLTYDGGDLIFRNFGLKSRYEIQANRIPRPDRPPWRSAPNAQLWGELRGYTGQGGLFEGDRWSKCWMVRRQTLYQFVFGPSGPVARTIGEGIDVQTIFFEENQSRLVTHRLPGFQPMPQVVLNSIFPGLSVWAELEVRFEIQLEGNSFFWIHPFDVLVALSQWPLEPL